MHDLKKQAEAVLFAAGNRIEIGEIARLCRTDVNSLKKALKELKKDYDEKNSSLMISEEGNFWKLAVREAYMDLVQQINPHTELNKTTIETLAVIAWKAPILQSDVIKTRTNKAYDHIKELVDSGFLIKQRHGRSYILRLSNRFFEYFDLKDKKDIKERFKDFADINEEEIKKAEEERLKKEKEAEKAKEESEEEQKQTEEQDKKEKESEEKSKEKAEETKAKKTEEQDKKEKELEETKEEAEEIRTERTEERKEQRETAEKETKEQTKEPVEKE
ncbi:MAG: SMC-Scp complex subunit ScpB [Nanoarchaeota archaeon]|nr:SMC-Scp complex subunit ScpB [Nanoarchaeota archaeon]